MPRKMILMEQFAIDYNYNGASYSGLVTPREENGEMFYAVRIESENQRYQLDIVVGECDTGNLE